MPFAPVSLPPGVVKPATPLQAKGRYWDANLIRWQAGKLQPVGGWQRITETPLTGAARAIFAWADNSNISYAAIGCETKLYILEGSTFTDVTPAGYVGPDVGQIGAYGAWDYGELLYGDDTDATYPRPQSSFYIPSFTWTFDNWGEDLLAVSSSDGRLLHWTAGEDEAHPVGFSEIVSAARVSNVVTVTTDFHHGLKTGDVVTIAGNSVSAFNATWTIASVPTDVTFTFSNSGTDTTGTGGTVTVSGIPANNRGVAVTQERHAVLFGCGGNPRRVAWSNREDYTNWNFSDPANTAGFLDLETQSRIIMATSVREGVLLWTDDEAWLMRFIGLPYVYSIERIGYGCGLMAPRSFATFAGRCIWMGREGFWIYDGGYVKPLPCDVGSYIFENIDPLSGMLYTNGSENNLFPEVWFWYPEAGETCPNKYVIYNYAEGWWSIGSMCRTAACGAGVFPYPIAGDDHGDIFYQDNGWTAAGASLVGDRWVESGALNLQQGNTMTFVRQALTDSGYGYSSTALTFYTSFTPEGSETTSGPYSPRSDGYTDTRATGRDFRVKIEATEDAPWSIGEMRLDLVPQGGRR